MKNIWIIGLGQFGLHAVRYLSKNNKDIQFVLVDAVEANLMQAAGRNRSLERADGVIFLERNLHTNTGPDWIIPALPVHLAAEWCLVRQKPEGFSRVILPAEIKPLLPNPMEGYKGDIYVSHADFRCPGDCAEPRDICTVTRKPRKRNMFEVLADIKMPAFQSLVIRSHQLGPGIGGYRPVMLFELLERVKQAGSNLLVSTACRCHGVVTGMARIYR
jgi:glycine/D-amino acid oxidase-like deaminating enzyme